MPDVLSMVIHSTCPRSYYGLYSGSSNEVLLESKFIPSPKVVTIRISIKLNICGYMYILMYPLRTLYRNKTSNKKHLSSKDNKFNCFLRVS